MQEPRLRAQARGLSIYHKGLLHRRAGRCNRHRDRQTSGTRTRRRAPVPRAPEKSGWLRGDHPRNGSSPTVDEPLRAYVGKAGLKSP